MANFLSLFHNALKTAKRQFEILITYVHSSFTCGWYEELEETHYYYKYVVY